MTATSGELNDMQDLLFPPGYVAVASGHFSSLLLAGPCVASNSLGSIEASRYDNGILCSFQRTGYVLRTAIKQKNTDLLYH